jgi:HK97 family phage major capsid protein
MASLKAKLIAVAEEAKALNEVAKPTAVQTARLDALVKYGKTLRELVKNEQTIDDGYARLSAMMEGSVGPETEDGFAPGVGRITGAALKAVWEANAKSGGIPSGNDFRVPSVRAKDVDASGLLVAPVRDAEEYTLPMKPSLLTAFVPAKTIESNDFTYLVQKTRDNQATVVADGAGKPTSKYDFDEKSGTLDTIAHMSEFIKNRLLQDKVNLSTWLYGEMALGLDLAAEAELVAAILADTDVQSQLFVTNFITTVRKAVTKLQAKYVKADFLAVSLEDAEALDLAADGIDRFYFAGPQGSGSSPLWSVPVVANDAIPAGTAIMGSASAGLRRYVNGMAMWAVDTLTEFETNQTRSRLEQRSKSVVTRPFTLVVIETALGS